MENTLTKIELKVNDIYSFRYSEAEVKKRFEPYHCFDGTLIVKKITSGAFQLVDTYWVSGDSRTFTLDRALAEGELKFLCNLDEVEKISEYDQKYYNDEDVVAVRMHAGYRTEWYIKKGTQRSQLKMIESVMAKIAEEKRKIESAEWQIKNQTGNLVKIEAGDTKIYI